MLKHTTEAISHRFPSLAENAERIRVSINNLRQHDPWQTLFDGKIGYRQSQALADMDSLSALTNTFRDDITAKKDAELFREQITAGRQTISEALPSLRSRLMLSTVKGLSWDAVLWGAYNGVITAIGSVQQYGLFPTHEVPWPTVKPILIWAAFGLTGLLALKSVGHEYSQLQDDQANTIDEVRENLSLGVAYLELATDDDLTKKALRRLTATNTTPQLNDEEESDF